MRRTLSIVVVVGIAVTAFVGGFALHSATDGPAIAAAHRGAHHGVLSVPTVRETFTTLACSSSTTLGLEGCAEHHVVALDRTINTLRRDLWPRLRTRRARVDFIIAERAWFSYRGASCTSQSDLYQGGSLSVVTYADCLFAFDRQHVGELRDTISLYQQGQ